MQVHELITKRWSPVAFDSKPLDAETEDLLFRAASWAPSSRNAQPWRFIKVHRGTPDFHVFLGLLTETNREWAQHAPMLVLGLGQIVSTYKNRPNRLALYETGMAVSMLLIQATHLGLSVHQMSGFDEEKAREVLVVPTRYEPAAMMAIGYHGKTDGLSPKNLEWEKRERTRMDLDDFVLEGACKSIQKLDSESA